MKEEAVKFMYHGRGANHQVHNILLQAQCFRVGKSPVYSHKIKNRLKEKL